ncbi:tetratricopeptide repeat protein [Psychrobacillus vulpis]|uniref:Tetratricopeptide repeat protein n=1 Tax=Psychrobacillus vulpis TaxID=2325572 RepID=A0A544TP12_9BACI|nr:tetratricopeptide repeat protein [Psychrobacillus vulpis]TQR19165.1 hypothetical protein FG384_14260 [Psychrobacillus vulpis]
MNTNQKAIEMLEKNEYEQALVLFQKAVSESRDVQSLNNLAWIYRHEEEDNETALELIKEAVSMNPSSYFPYNLLGEIYLETKMWQEASNILLQSIKIQPSIEAYKNLGVAKYHLGEFQEALEFFLLGANSSDYSMYSHIICLVKLGELTEAKKKLNTFSEEDDEFVGEIEVAELYVDMGCFHEAIRWFDKGWESYYKQPNWVTLYVFSLLKNNSITRAHEIVEQSILQKSEEITDAHNEICDEDWSENDKKQHIKKLLDEKMEYENIIEQISNGFIPIMKFDTSIYTGCYLFGCKRHNHPEYQD